MTLTIEMNELYSRAGKKKNSPRKLKFRYFHQITIFVSNARSNPAKPTLAEHPEGKIVKSADERSERKVKATITRCDLSPRFFCIDATLLCEFESDKI